MGFEELLHKVGGFGPFQLRNLVLLALPRFLLPMHFLLPIFMAAVPAHHCALPDAPANLSHQDLWLKIHLPRETDGSFSSCLRFAYPQALPNVTLGTEVDSSGEPEGEPLTVPCSQGWEYDRSEFSSTIATEWDLVCQQRGLNKVTSTCFFIGMLLGAVVYGYLSDRFGRRRLLLVAYVSTLALGLMSAASVNYIMFVTTRMLTGSALAGFTIIVLPLELEWLDVEHRTVAGVISTTFWTGGVLLLTLVGYLIRSWRWLLLAATLPCVPGIISIWWVPESARWLLTQGRVEEAKKYLSICAKLNGRPMSEDSLSQEVLNKVVTMERVSQRPSYLDLFRTTQLRQVSLCCMVMWFGVNFSYYGLTLDASGLGLNVYQTQLLFGAVEVPSKITVFFLVRRVGRRLTEAGMLLATALTFGISLLVSSGMCHHCPASTGNFIFCTGKPVLEVARTRGEPCNVWLLQPFLNRQRGMGFTALIGRLGASLAPLVVLLDGVWLLLPKLAYGGISFLAACIVLLLPETKKEQLPETIQDVERKGYMCGRKKIDRSGIALT
ncbi:solute carrier family 22 member 7 [Mus caroli]|uniref:Solute carrier family 22 member 7 n=1 Tax=Mus caroli TaxID=10089 RepID=A0A6P5NWR6_MUSCR|nr:solute carrier family 22 member 7 [Mus caroli]